jgi:hypothetical protein
MSVLCTVNFFSSTIVTSQTSRKETCHLLRVVTIKRDVNVYYLYEQSILIRVVDHVYHFRTHTVLSSFRFEISKNFLVNIRSSTSLVGLKIGVISLDNANVLSGSSAELDQQ